MIDFIHFTLSITHEHLNILCIRLISEQKKHYNNNKIIFTYIITLYMEIQMVINNKKNRVSHQFKAYTFI